MRTCLAGTFAVAALLLTGCTGDPAVPPAELADAIENTEVGGGLAVPPEKADCIADVYADSDLSDEYLEALLDGKTVPDVSDDDRETLADLAPDIASCL